MSDAIQNFLQSELALAAYSNLNTDMPLEAYRGALQQGGKGMSLSQAQNFTEDWSIIDQHTDPSSGLSATIFQKVVDGNPTGPKYLAIRGTEPNAADLTADGLLALGLPASLIPQFAALKAHLDTVWLADGGKLHGKTFTVTGHSLG
ncbi:MAG: hypothetical protein RBS40_15510 [Rhodocyclaceae bacterium]|jgi:hypothetical protein|nr:hypothetical protein [Rhodocyclaceae bacterium]